MRCLFVVAMLAAGPAAAQNLLSNADFDTDIAGWTSFLGGQPAWSPDDCCGNPQSGSISLAMGPSSFTYVGSDCVDVTPGASYDLVVRAETLPVPPGALEGSAEATVMWYSSGLACTLIPLMEPGLSIPAAGGWRGFGMTFTAPGDAVAAKVVLSARSGSLSTSIDAHFDEVRFGPTGSVPVTLETFYVE